MFVFFVAELFALLCRNIYLHTVHLNVTDVVHFLKAYYMLNAHLYKKNPDLLKSFKHDNDRQ